MCCFIAATKAGQAGIWCMRSTKKDSPVNGTSAPVFRLMSES